MKKLVVHESEFEGSFNEELELFSTMHMSYGVFDFSTEKMVEAICRQFNLQLLEASHPTFELTDGERVISLIFKEEYFG